MNAKHAIGILIALTIGGFITLYTPEIQEAAQYESNVNYTPLVVVFLIGFAILAVTGVLKRNKDGDS